MTSTTVRLSPQPVKIVEHVGDTCTINVNAVEAGVDVDLTAWTITAAVYDRAGGTLTASFAVTGTTTRTLTLSAAQTTTLGRGHHWYEVKGVDASAVTFTLAHGVFELEY